MIVRNSNGKARKGKVGDEVVMSLVDSGAFAVMGSIGLQNLVICSLYDDLVSAVVPLFTLR